MAAVEAWGGVDILVNNAGIQQTASLAEMPTPTTWDAILAVNLSAAFHTMRAALPAMAERGYGRVVNIASVHGLVASVNKAPYVAAKHGLVGLSQGRRAGIRHRGRAAHGRRHGQLHRAGLDRNRADRAADRGPRRGQFGGDRDDGIAELLAEKQPSQRTSDPSEIGALALWLCAPARPQRDRHHDPGRRRLDRAIARGRAATAQIGFPCEIKGTRKPAPPGKNRASRPRRAYPR